MTATIAGYCQFQLLSQVNDTRIYFAKRVKLIRHDRTNRLRTKANMKPSDLWKRIKNDVVSSEKGYLIFYKTLVETTLNHN